MPGPSGEAPLLEPHMLVNGKLLDPWRSDYVYHKQGDTGFEVMSYGADGAPGGVGDSADLVVKYVK